MAESPNFATSSPVHWSLCTDVFYDQWPSFYNHIPSFRVGQWWSLTSLLGSHPERKVCSVLSPRAKLMWHFTNNNNNNGEIFTKNWKVVMLEVKLELNVSGVRELLADCRHCHRSRLCRRSQRSSGRQTHWHEWWWRKDEEVPEEVTWGKENLTWKLLLEVFCNIESTKDKMLSWPRLRTESGRLQGYRKGAPSVVCVQEPEGRRCPNYWW